MADRLPRTHQVWTSYFIAFLCVVISFALRDLLARSFGIYAVGATFFPSVLIAALLGGLPVGLFAAALSAVCLWVFVLPHRLFPLGPISYLAVGNLAVFAASFILVAILAAHHRTLRLRSEANRQHIAFMMDELRHRVKNILAVVQGMSWQIAKRSANLESYQEAFNERLVTLARTHDILVKRNWTAVSLLDLIAAHIGAFNNAGELSVAGEVTFLEPVAAEQLGLALYELASNCIKYGAWKQAGNVSIEWSVTDHGFLELRWMERGAREKSDNERQGFGKLILTTVIPEALSGTANWRENDDGILWQVSIHPKFFRFQDASARAIADGLVPVEATIPTDVLDRRKTSP